MDMTNSTDLRGGMLVRRVTTGKVYRVKPNYRGEAMVTVNEHGTWVTVVGQRNGRDFGRMFGFSVDELEQVEAIKAVID